ncbi:uncharacterized protein LOC123531732 isoform X2 [Mercenaria mercenaria]|uniref:uncharacterized protein LOC123531732 isoform X2 n=1 Tax=Mercenaria mercenaria TaxID=6596 RepID=UPI00234E7DC9|nr:uncharacterized protein LOC123531732 isoform X2 [Mercenaria mercenaria]
MEFSSSFSTLSIKSRYLSTVFMQKLFQPKEAFVNLAHLEGERKEEVLHTSQKLWDQFVFRGKTGPVTEDGFIQMINDDLKKDRKKFEENMRKACIDDLKIVSQSGNDYLTEEEFINAYKAVGFGNDDWNKKLFQAFDPVDGKVNNDKIVEVWFQFLVSEDSSKKDVALELLESYPDL